MNIAVRVRCNCMRVVQWTEPASLLHDTTGDVCCDLGQKDDFRLGLRKVLLGLAASPTRSGLLCIWIVGPGTLDAETSAYFSTSPMSKARNKQYLLGSERLEPRDDYTEPLRFSEPALAESSPVSNHQSSYKEDVHTHSPSALGFFAG